MLEEKPAKGEESDGLGGMTEESQLQDLLSAQMAAGSSDAVLTPTRLNQ